MLLDYTNIPVSAQGSVEALASWCIEQLSSRNEGLQVKERPATAVDDGLEYAASVTTGKGPEGRNISIYRMTVYLPQDHALSNPWEVVEEISQGAVATQYYA